MRACTARGASTRHRYHRGRRGSRVRARVRPGRGVSVVGFVVGVGFLVFGVFFLLPTFSGFGEGFRGFGPLGGFVQGFALLWIVVAGGITLYHGYNMVSGRVASAVDIELEPTDDRGAPAGAVDDVEARLRRLERLRADGLVTAAEYEQKRAEILAEPW